MLLESRKDKLLSISSLVLFQNITSSTELCKNMSKVLDWDDSKFGKEVFLSLSGQAAEHINDMPTTEICNADKLFEKLDKTFLPKNYQRAILEEFRSLKYKTGNKLSEFYVDLKTAYMKARPSAHSSLMDEVVTAHLDMIIPPEVYP